MSDRFVALPAQQSVVERLSGLAPGNPFATAGYFEAKRMTGSTPWVLAKENGAGDLECGCGAFLLPRGLGRKAEILSLPELGVDSPFWDQLQDFCRRHHVVKLELGTFGSPAGVQIPDLGACVRHTRCEWILDLDVEIDARIDRRHRSHLKKARRAGLTIERTRSTEAVDGHRAMIDSSMDRRRGRGEDAPSAGPSREFAALLQSGAGELYQAFDDGTMVASGLVLRAPSGAYFHSRGTSPEGMAIGASHFLLYSIMMQLKAEGALTFNIGGADEGSGLERFKKRFGASPTHLPSATCYVGPFWARKATRSMEWVRSRGEHRRRIARGA